MTINFSPNNSCELLWQRYKRSLPVHSIDSFEKLFKEFDCSEWILQKIKTDYNSPKLLNLLILGFYYYPNKHDYFYNFLINTDKDYTLPYILLLFKTDNLNINSNTFNQHLIHSVSCGSEYFIFNNSDILKSKHFSPKWIKKSINYHANETPANIESFFSYDNIDGIFLNPNLTPNDLNFYIKLHEENHQKEVHINSILNSPHLDFNLLYRLGDDNYSYFSDDQKEIILNLSQKLKPMSFLLLSEKYPFIKENSVVNALDTSIDVLELSC